MVTIYEQSEREPRGNDAASLIARHDILSSSFWIERGEVLIVTHVCDGAEGFFVQWQPDTRDTTTAAISRAPHHGLALTYDGGGNWLIIDRGCVIDASTAVAVLDHFLRTGQRSDLVEWGSGIVRTSVEDEPGWEVQDLDDRPSPHHRLPGGLRAELLDAPDPELAPTATWRVLNELAILDPGWLRLLAAHPMKALRRLEVWDAEDLSGLTAAIAALPALEELTVFGPAVRELPALQSPSLRRIVLGRADEDNEPDEEEDPDWSSKVAARLAACSLPALEDTEITWLVDLPAR